MKVIAKFASSFLVVSMVLLGMYGYFAASQEVAQLDESVTKDLLTLGGVLREGLQRLPEGERDLGKDRLVEAARAKRKDLRISWHEGATDATDAASKVPTGSDFHQIVVRLPLRRADSLHGVLELSRDVPDEALLMRKALATELLFAVGLAASGSLLAVVLGGALIGRPLQRVVQQARRIGAGDFSARLRETRSDEIGELKRELNVMCDALEASRKRLEDEQAARVQTMEQLRHLDRLRTVGTFASGLAHELGTPLNVLLLRGQALASGSVAAGDLPATGTMMVGQVQKMSQIVRQLLDFARKKPRERSRVALEDVAEGAKRLLDAIARKHGATIELEIEDRQEVQGDASQLEQALTNLIVNGIHAMTSGGTLRLRVWYLADAKVPNSGRCASMMVVSVKDEGTGLDEETLKKIFEPFFTTKSADQGTGLGLSVAREIVEDHGGWIDAESSPGQGSTFSMYIPVAS
jgi:signal transduction histidine kinase